MAPPGLVPAQHGCPATNQRVVAPPCLTSLRNSRLVAQSGRLARMPLVQHSRAILDPADVKPGELRPVDHVAVHGSPPEQIFVVAAHLEKETAPGSLDVDLA